MASAGVRSYTKRDGTQVSSHTRGYTPGTFRSEGARAAKNAAALGAGALGVAAMVVELLGSMVGLVNAVVLLVTALLGGLGYRKRHKVRRAVRRVRRAVPGSTARINARARRRQALRRQRWDRQDEKWTRRREALGAAVRRRRGVGSSP